MSVVYSFGDAVNAFYHGCHAKTLAGNVHTSKHGVQSN